MQMRREKNIWSTIVVSPVIQDMWYCTCLSMGSFWMSAWRMVLYFTQLVCLGHNINLSSVESCTFGFLLGFGRWIPFLDYETSLLELQVRVAYFCNISVHFDNLWVEIQSRKRQFSGNLELECLYLGVNTNFILATLGKILQALYIFI